MRFTKAFSEVPFLPPVPFCSVQKSGVMQSLGELLPCVGDSSCRPRPRLYVMGDREEVDFSPLWLLKTLAGFPAPVWMA